MSGHALLVSLSSTQQQQPLLHPRTLPRPSSSRERRPHSESESEPPFPGRPSILVPRTPPWPPPIVDVPYETHLSQSFQGTRQRWTKGGKTAFQVRYTTLPSSTPSSSSLLRSSILSSRIRCITTLQCGKRRRPLAGYRLDYGLSSAPSKSSWPATS